MFPIGSLQVEYTGKIHEIAHVAREQVSRKWQLLKGLYHTEDQFQPKTDTNNPSPATWIQVKVLGSGNRGEPDQR